MTNFTDLSPGSLIADRYRIVSMIGKGGNGRVYRVFDKKLEKDWALKQCDILMDTELSVLRKIEYPVFPRIVDVITQQNEQYLIMDYFNGSTLQQLITRHPMGEKQVRKIGLEIATALLYLHEMTPSVCYLDCKPENIILTEQGELHMIDVGSAIIGKNDAGKYRISGTKAYAPEEQRKTDDQSLIDARTDIYSFGKTLYVLLTGSTREYRNRKGDLNIRSANPRISYAMQRFLARCCYRRPEKRFQSMEEVLYFLNHFEAFGRGERWKLEITSFLLHLWQGMIAAGCLLGGYFYTCKKNILWLIICGLLGMCLFLACRGRGSVVYELEKDVYGCMGSKLLLPFLVIGLLWSGGISHASAGERTEDSVKQLSVTVYDEQGRKLLIRQGSALETEGDILLQLSIKDLEQGTHRVTLSCEDEDGRKKAYQFQYNKE